MSFVVDAEHEAIFANTFNWKHMNSSVALTMFSKRTD